MWIIIAAVAVVVLGFAAFAGLGKFGEMPAHAVNDRPKGVVPDGPVNDALLAALKIPTASSGYDRAEVDEYLRGIAAGTAAPAADTLFTVVKRGYDMQVVDNLIERPRYERPTAAVDVDDPSGLDATGESDEAHVVGEDEADGVAEVIELGEETEFPDVVDADKAIHAPSREGLRDAE